MPSFDLRDRPWIPVRYVHGASGPPMTGLAGLFLRAHEIADITVPVPPAASGLWRILYLIAARISGLGDLEAAGRHPAVEAGPEPGPGGGPVRSRCRREVLHRAR